MISGYQSEVLKKYEDIRTIEKHNLKERIKEVKNKHPEILEIDDEIKKLSVKLPLLILKSTTTEEDIQNLKDKIFDLRAKKIEALVSKGYTPEYLTLHHRCTKCSDTGYIGIKRCSCFKEKLIRLYYKDSALETIVSKYNFNDFDLSLFPNKTDPSYPTQKITPFENMQRVYDFITSQYIPKFDYTDVNLLFSGTAGTGKTFLSYCIAKELLDQGHLVVYKTADELIRILADIRFNKNKSLEDLILNCDLLIIDDLGSEQITEFSKTEFFNLLNKKLLLGKKMIISTNLRADDLDDRYDRRISSRLIGHFKFMIFYTNDLRIEKKRRVNSNR
ncbi:MAG: ATP-binding protein [Clostridium sp.]|uniref:ATP-binding protein n=1 Tax=Clostridium sp. TaxID=1506 RepID=UPI003F3C809D